jgi:predicted ATPase
LTANLRDRQVLLILDNCEHLLEACAQLAHTLLQACPGVRLLATSRQPLGVAGEAVYRVPTLSFPDPEHLPAVEKMNDFVAVRLFVDRARLVLADYKVTNENAIHIARICRRLDGIPLAVEMAAARANLLSAEQLADRLDDAFLLLTSGSRTALPRQKTLRATIDWSYALLSREERWLLQRLSTFSGGCTLEAAESVCPVDGEGATTLDVLASLVAKSMAQADRRQGDEARYRLLEVIRQYAGEKLHDAGGDAGLAGRHSAYYLALAETAILKVRSSERPAWSRKIQSELENLRQAADWSLRHQMNIEAGLRLVVAMNGLWPSHQENLEWPKHAIAACQGRADVPAGLLATVLGMAARWAAQLDTQAAAEWARQAVQISRGLGPTGKPSLMGHLFSQGLIGLMGAVHLDDVETLLEPFAEVESILQELGSDRLAGEQYLSTMASLALRRAAAALNQGQFEAARLQAGKSGRLYEQARNPWGGYLSHICAGSALLNLGDLNQARDQFVVALRLADETGNPARKTYVRGLLGSTRNAGPAGEMAGS